MAESPNRQPNSTSPSEAENEPLGLNHPLLPAKPLGLNWLQPKFLEPLGARPISILESGGLFLQRSPGVGLPGSLLSGFPDSAAGIQPSLIEAEHGNTEISSVSLTGPEVPSPQPPAIQPLRAKTAQPANHQGTPDTTPPESSVAPAPEPSIAQRSVNSEVEPSLTSESNIAQPSAAATSLSAQSASDATSPIAQPQSSVASSSEPSFTQRTVESGNEPLIPSDARIVQPLAEEASTPIQLQSSEPSLTTSGAGSIPEPLTASPPPEVQRVVELTSEPSLTTSESESISESLTASPPIEVQRTVELTADSPTAPAPEIAQSSPESSVVQPTPSYNETLSPTSRSPLNPDSAAANSEARVVQRSTASIPASSDPNTVQSSTRSGAGSPAPSHEATPASVPESTVDSGSVDSGSPDTTIIQRAISRDAEDIAPPEFQGKASSSPETESTVDRVSEAGIVQPAVDSGADSGIESPVSSGSSLSQPVAEATSSTIQRQSAGFSPAPSSADAVVESSTSSQPAEFQSATESIDRSAASVPADVALSTTPHDALPSPTRESVVHPEASESGSSESGSSSSLAQRALDPQVEAAISPEPGIVQSSAGTTRPAPKLEATPASATPASTAQSPTQSPTQSITPASITQSIADPVASEPTVVQPAVAPIAGSTPVAESSRARSAIEAEVPTTQPPLPESSPATLGSKGVSPLAESEGTSTAESLVPTESMAIQRSLEPNASPAGASETRSEVISETIVADSAAESGAAPPAILADSTASLAPTSVSPSSLAQSSPEGLNVAQRSIVPKTEPLTSPEPDISQPAVGVSPPTPQHPTPQHPTPQHPTPQHNAAGSPVTKSIVNPGSESGVVQPAGTPVAEPPISPASSLASSMAQPAADLASSMIQRQPAEFPPAPSSSEAMVESSDSPQSAGFQSTIKSSTIKSSAIESIVESTESPTASALTEVELSTTSAAILSKTAVESAAASAPAEVADSTASQDALPSPTRGAVRSPASESSESLELSESSVAQRAVDPQVESAISPEPSIARSSTDTTQPTAKPEAKPASATQLTSDSVASESAVGQGAVDLMAESAVVAESSRVQPGVELPAIQRQLTESSSVMSGSDSIAASSTAASSTAASSTAASSTAASSTLSQSAGSQRAAESSAESPVPLASNIVQPSGDVEAIRPTSSQNTPSSSEIEAVVEPASGLRSVQRAVESASEPSVSPELNIVQSFNQSDVSSPDPQQDALDSSTTASTVEPVSEAGVVQRWFGSEAESVALPEPDSVPPSTVPSSTEETEATTSISSAKTVTETVTPASSNNVTRSPATDATVNPAAGLGAVQRSAAAETESGVSSASNIVQSAAEAAVPTFERQSLASSDLSESDLSESESRVVQRATGSGTESLLPAETTIQRSSETRSAPSILPEAAAVQSAAEGETTTPAKSALSSRRGPLNRLVDFAKRLVGGGGKRMRSQTRRDPQPLSSPQTKPTADKSEIVRPAARSSPETASFPEADPIQRFSESGVESAEAAQQTMASISNDLGSDEGSQSSRVDTGSQSSLSTEDSVQRLPVEEVESSLASNELLQSRQEMDVSSSAGAIAHPTSYKATPIQQPADYSPTSPFPDATPIQQQPEADNTSPARPDPGSATASAPTASAPTAIDGEIIARKSSIEPTADSISETSIGPTAASIPDSPLPSTSMPIAAGELSTSSSESSAKATEARVRSDTESNAVLSSPADSARVQRRPIADKGSETEIPEIPTTVPESAPDSEPEIGSLPSVVQRQMGSGDSSFNVREQNVAVPPAAAIASSTPDAPPGSLQTGSSIDPVLVNERTIDQTFTSPSPTTTAPETVPEQPQASDSPISDLATSNLATADLSVSDLASIQRSATAETIEAATAETAIETSRPSLPDPLTLQQQAAAESMADSDTARSHSTDTVAAPATESSISDFDIARSQSTEAVLERLASPGSPSVQRRSDSTSPGSLISDNLTSSTPLTSESESIGSESIVSESISPALTSMAQPLSDSVSPISAPNPTAPNPTTSTSADPEPAGSGSAGSEPVVSESASSASPSIVQPLSDSNAPALSTRTPSVTPSTLVSGAIGSEVSGSESGSPASTSSVQRLSDSSVSSTTVPASSSAVSAPTPFPSGTPLTSVSESTGSESAASESSSPASAPIVQRSPDLPASSTAVPASASVLSMPPESVVSEAAAPVPAPDVQANVQKLPDSLASDSLASLDRPGSHSSASPVLSTPTSEAVGSETVSSVSPSLVQRSDLASPVPSTPASESSISKAGSKAGLSESVSSRSEALGPSPLSSELSSPDAGVTVQRFAVSSEELPAAEPEAELESDAISQGGGFAHAPTIPPSDSTSPAPTIASSEPPFPASTASTEPPFSSGTPVLQPFVSANLEAISSPAPGTDQPQTPSTATSPIARGEQPNEQKTTTLHRDIPTNAPSILPATESTLARSDFTPVQRLATAQPTAKSQAADNDPLLAEPTTTALPISPSSPSQVPPAIVREPALPDTSLPHQTASTPADSVDPAISDISLQRQIVSAPVGPVELIAEPAARPVDVTPTTEPTVAQLLPEAGALPQIPTVLENLVQPKLLGLSDSLMPDSELSAAETASTPWPDEPPSSRSVEPFVAPSSATIPAERSDTGKRDVVRRDPKPSAAAVDGPTIQAAPVTRGRTPLSAIGSIPAQWPSMMSVPANQEVPDSWSNLAELLGQEVAGSETPTIQRSADSALSVAMPDRNVMQRVLDGESVVKLEDPEQEERDSVALQSLPSSSQLATQRLTTAPPPQSSDAKNLPVAIASRVSNQYQQFGTHLQSLVQRLAIEDESDLEEDTQSQQETNEGFQTFTSPLFAASQSATAEGKEEEAKVEDEKATARILELLAQEIYGIVRQRIEIDRERREGLYYSGRLPW